MARRPTPLDEIPSVCFLEDVAAALGSSRSTIKRLRAAGTFPIRELPSLDSRPRWSGERVREFIRDVDARKLRRVG